MMLLLPRLLFLGKSWAVNAASRLSLSWLSGFCGDVAAVAAELCHLDIHLENTFFC